ncbi:hypothetical protein [Nocardia wallacei]|uniref:hypothetical protein n=1 Tax=Nocardia wallacei TaxID=480035 RepID=UPI002458A1C0|nr:hypothetical protein [Nocardia wallacei]
MSPWESVHSVLAVVGAGLFAVVAVGCVWPVIRPRHEAPARHRPARAHRPMRPMEWPMDWTCDLPNRPLSLRDAHRAMQLHREHGCARKRAAFAMLVAHGHIVPDSARQHSFWGSGR